MTEQQPNRVVGHPLSSGVDARAGRWADEARDRMTKDYDTDFESQARDNRLEADAAWAEVRRLREALEQIVAGALGQARAALAGEQSLNDASPTRGPTRTTEEDNPID